MMSHSDIEVSAEKYDNLPKASNIRTVVTMTTIPERIDMMKPVLNSLLTQSVRVDEIALNIPRVSRKGNMYQVPNWLSALKNVTVHRVEKDEGPGTKIFPTLRREPHGTIIIAVDDDNIYHSNMVEGLVKEYYRYKKKYAITNYGMSMSPELKFPFKYDRTLKTFGGAREVDFVQGCSGFLISSGMIPPEGLDIEKGPKEALTVDDMWISGWLHIKGIKIMQPGFNLRYVPLPYIKAGMNTPSLIRGENKSRVNDLTTIEWFRQTKGMKLLYERNSKKHKVRKNNSNKHKKQT